jgi:membrane-bound serine protease (ClpP class)
MRLVLARKAAQAKRFSAENRGHGVARLYLHLETPVQIVTPRDGAVLASGPATRQFLALMLRSLFKALVCVALAGTFGVFARVADVLAPVPPTLQAKKVSVIIIPVRDQIAEPIHYILRRGLKQGADVVVLDMETPGGSAGTALEIMESLSKFSGKTITYVNAEAMSAGAFIAAASEEIWFAPNGVIGAAAAVTAQGADIPETMRLKLNSFLRAKIRAVSEGKGYRGEVVSAMIDKDYELKIGDKVLKGKGELLSLTATEAAKTYGEPAQALLAAGIAKNIDDLLTQKYGAGNYVKKTFEVTWSEKLAQYLNIIKPILLGLGLLALYIEFKTPGFGVFGLTGIVLLAIVFLSSYVAGLSGHEPILVFAVGVVLVALELAFFHTGGVLGVFGIVMMGGSLLWAMADFWPNQPISVAWSSDLLLVPLQNMLIALVVAGVLLALIAKYLPQGWFWQRLALGGAVTGAGVATEVLTEQESLVGREGVAATSLFPSGQVEIDGRRHEARLEVGFVEAGTPIRVVRKTDFGLVVEEKKS